MHAYRFRRGFSIIELTIVMLVMGIMAAVAIPRWARTVHQVQVDAAVARIKTDLALARETAISKSASQTVQFVPATGAYTLVGIADPDRPAQAYTVKLPNQPYRTTLTTATFGADSTIIFDLYGQPDSSGTITVSSGGISRTLLVDSATGLARTP